MDRRQILELIDARTQRGLEIGALDRPVVRKSVGPISYVDRASRDELLSWYADPGHAIDRDALVEVDHVWGEETLLQAVGGERAFDYVIASHVIEHVPDVYGWLAEIAAVLRDDGQALFMIPDKRYTFDRARPVTVSGEFVDAHLRGLRRPDTRQIFNHFYDTLPENGPARDEAGLTALAQGSLALCRRAITNQEYIDAHCWVFTPRSFVAALDLASRLDLLPFEISHLIPTPRGDGEFLAALRRLPDGLDAAGRRARFVASVAALDLPPEVLLEGGDDLMSRAEMAIARAAAIENSTIWRATAPLRKLMDGLRGRR